MFGRTTVLIALAVALALPASAPARQVATKAPTGLKAFLLRSDEPTRHSFTRSPSFSWKVTSQATSYDFQLSTSSTFRENSIIWSKTGLANPYTGIPIALPWISGHPYSMFARVRAHTERRTTAWSDDYGFNLKGEKPTQLSAPNGLLRWTPIEGATAYEVWEKDVAGIGATVVWSKSYMVATNVTDMRDWFTFHRDSSWVGNAQWRVRAVRGLNGSVASNGLPITTYGPWSRLFTTSATTQTATTVALGSTVSDVIGTPGSPKAHSLMPGFSWTGSQAPSGEQTELYRAYVYSDDECVNPVMIGSLVGSPAWVPRLSGALTLPTSLAELADAVVGVLKDGGQGTTYSNSPGEITPNETGGGADILDLSDRKWPSGVYYWTVVPVRIGLDPDDKLMYKDAELPQDVCSAGRIARFGRVGVQVQTGNKKAYVTSLALSGGVRSSAASGVPRIYGNTPLVTWTPVLSADRYEVQWSRKHYPFVPVGNVITQGTSATLTLAPGTWYYRVRGVNLQVGTQTMAWSSVRKVRIARPVFRLK
jgi:hypothetical protein